MKILITGFPYVRKNFSETFNYFPKGNEIYFLLPDKWKVKKGKVIYKPAEQENIFTTRTIFYHSNYPIFGGSFKGFMPFFPFHLWRIKTSKNIDMVYVCSEPGLVSTFYFNLWSRFFGLKIVNFTWENIDPRIKFTGLKGWFQIFLLKLNLLLVDGVVCGNEKGQKIINDIISKPTAHIPMSGVNPEFFKKGNYKKELNNVNLEDKIVLTFVGAIGKRKGLDTLISAFKEALSKNKDLFLVLVGSGEYEENLKLKIKELGLGASTIFIPWADHKDLIKILSISDIFLYPSISYGGWEEQFGYSMAEASLMELPIIATRTGSIEEVVKDGVTGILANENSSEELFRAIVELSDNSELRDRLGTAGRKFIMKNFSHQEIANKFDSFFNSLLFGKDK